MKMMYTLLIPFNPHSCPTDGYFASSKWINLFWINPKWINSWPIMIKLHLNCLRIDSGAIQMDLFRSDPSWIDSKLLNEQNQFIIASASIWEICCVMNWSESMLNCMRISYECFIPFIPLIFNCILIVLKLI
jgi:hypothetical protein